MSGHVVDEKCSCGAEFHWRGDYFDYVRKAAVEWREQHRHVEPAAVGICGDANWIDGPNPSALICDLPAGHAGWHRDGDRGRWGYPHWRTDLTTLPTHDQPEEGR